MMNVNDWPDDPLDDLLKGKAGPRELPQDEAAVRARAAAGPDGYEDKCPKCGGSGDFIGWSGRVLGKCRACNGKGKKVYKTSASVRADQRAARNAKKANRFATFVEQNAEVWNYLTGRAERWDFARDLMSKVVQYGDLTDNQMAAVKRAMERDAQRQQERAADAIQRQQTAKAVDVTRVVAALETAQAKGLKSPTLRLPGGYVFSLAKPESRNAGAVYVRGLAADKGSLEYLGKIVQGRFFRTRECTPDMEAEVLRLAANAAEEAVAYGKLTGRCACCGLELTNKVSVERGIGPICAEKFGF